MEVFIYIAVLVIIFKIALPKQKKLLEAPPVRTFKSVYQEHYSDLMLEINNINNAFYVTFYKHRIQRFKHTYEHLVDSIELKNDLISLNDALEARLESLKN